MLWVARSLDQLRGHPLNVYYKVRCFGQLTR